MKKTVLIVAGLLLVIVFLVVQFSKKTNVPRVDKTFTTETNTESSTSVDLDKTNQVPPSAVATDASTQDIMTRYRQGLISKEQAIQETLLEENKKTLDMYGKVIDQNGEPVADAKIEGAVELNVSFVKNKVELHFAKTDSEGRFSFAGLKGTGLGIWPKKDGYFYNLRQPSKRPDDYQPDLNNPVVFTMWKLRGAEPLVGLSIDSKIPHDGTPAIFDTATGKESVDGDLRISLVRSPAAVRRSGQTFDWELKIEMLRGWLMVQNDTYPYWAPESGYTSVFETNMNSNNPSWFSKLTQNFYIKNPQGQFGRMQASVYTALTPARIKFDFTVNPSGSQNLEPNVEK